MHGTDGTRGNTATVKVELEAWAWLDNEGFVALSLSQDPDDDYTSESDLEFTLVELIDEFSTYWGGDYEELLKLRNVFDDAASYIDGLVSQVEEDNLEGSS